MTNKQRRKIVLEAKIQIIDAINLGSPNSIFECIIEELIQKAINYTRCCTELPMIEELIISEIRRKQQKQVDDEVERFLNGNGTDCKLRGFFSEPSLDE